MVMVLMLELLAERDGTLEFEDLSDLGRGQWETHIVRACKERQAAILFLVAALSGLGHAQRVS